MLGGYLLVICLIIAISLTNSASTLRPLILSDDEKIITKHQHVEKELQEVDRTTSLSHATDKQLALTTTTMSSIRYPVLTFSWHSVEIAYTVVLWIMIASLAKIVFNLSKRVADAVPDSSLLIAIGLLMGVLLYVFQVERTWFRLDSHIFFLFLLPPIVFDAGYSMPNRAFFDNIGSILVFAVIGTIWNMAAIGLSLWAVGLLGIYSTSIPLVHILLFASIISAVDPVAVICVFEEISVHESLYINVFGESLLNDAVAVVLYRIFLGYTIIGVENLIPIDYAAGGISFIVVALGGVCIGLIFAVITSYSTKYTRKVPVLTPVFVFLLPYLAYLTAEMCGLSAIMAIVFCGIVMKQYIKENISFLASNAIKYFAKMSATCAETLVFMFLGLSTISAEHSWDTVFVLCTIGFCLLYRGIGVIIMCAILNKFRLRKFSKVEQFIMGYGGLRGAIAYGLVMAIPADVAARQIFVTTCIAVIIFTVFLQGLTMKPLVTWLHVERDDKREKNMAEYMIDRVADYTMTGIEDICQQKGHHSLRVAFESFNDKYIRPILVKNVDTTNLCNSKLIRAHYKISIMDALNAPSICDDKMREARAHERSNDRRMSHLSVVDNETSSIESTSPHSTMHSSVVLFSPRNHKTGAASYNGPYLAKNTRTDEDEAVNNIAELKIDQKMGKVFNSILPSMDFNEHYSRNPELLSSSSFAKLTSTNYQRRN